MVPRQILVHLHRVARCHRSGEGIDNQQYSQGNSRYRRGSSAVDEGHKPTRNDCYG
jgi:hypothetical protein